MKSVVIAKSNYLVGSIDLKYVFEIPIISKRENDLVFRVAAETSTLFWLNGYHFVHTLEAAQDLMKEIENSDKHWVLEKRGQRSSIEKFPLKIWTTTFEREFEPA